jgi:signal transduction histidine kinase
VVRGTGRWFVITAVGCTALVAASVAALLLTDLPEPPAVLRLPVRPASDILTGAIWIGVGLIAWRRRPANHMGLLLIAVGLATMLPWLLAAGGALGFTVSVALDDLAPVLGAHAFLAFPSGRLPGRSERRVMLGTYTLAAVSTVELLFRDYAAAGCGDCPANLLLVTPDAALADALVTVLQLGATVAAASMVVLLTLRWRRATPPARRVLAPVLWTSTAVTLIFAFNYVVDPFALPAADEVVGVAVGAIPVAFLVGLLRTRLQHSAVSDLLLELASPRSPAELREVLARTLGDPSLELAYWLPESGHYVDEAGRRVEPAEGPNRAVSPIERDGALLGALVYDPSLLEDPRLVESVGAAARMALENSRLQAALSAQLRIVRDSRARIVSAADTERRRIERNLHDGAQQRLLGIRLALRFARTSEARDELEAQLTAIDAEVADTLDELRAFARGLHPPVLTEQGLAAAIESLARRAALPVQVQTLPDERLPAAVESVAYYVAAEALANVVKHAEASRVTIAVERQDGHVTVLVADDGRGGANLQGSGLRGLRDRVEALDGTLAIDTAAGSGTAIRAELPCA